MRTIDDWIEALAGRGSHDAKDDPEIAALRAALRDEGKFPAASRMHLDHSPAEMPKDPQRLALLDRLRREGLLDNKPPRPPTIEQTIKRGALTWVGWSGSLAAAATLILALLIPAFVGGPDDPALVPHESDNFDDAPRLRGSADRLPINADIAWLARLIGHLQADGLPYRLRDMEVAWHLDFYVSDSFRASASEWLNAKSIPIPPMGWVRLEVAKEP